MEKKALRNQNDTVFRMLMENAQNALSLYNALNDTNYTDTSQLEYDTLENAIYMNMKNDISFVINNQLNLYEQQSTWNPNMPLRNLFYVTDILQDYVKTKQNRSIYSSALIQLPNPHFVILYNGRDKAPEVAQLRLSDAFTNGDSDPGLELKTLVININVGKNEQLKKKCPILNEYMIYVEKVRTYTRTMTLNDAVEKAVDECIQENVLKEFLNHQKSEVIKMSIYEYDEEEELRRIRYSEREYAREMAEEIAEGIAEGMAQDMAKRMAQDMAEGMAQDIVDKAISQLVAAYCELNMTKESAIDKLQKAYQITRDEAEEKVNMYWKTADSDDNSNQ